MSWNPEAPLSIEDWDSIHNETFVHAKVDPVTFRPIRNAANDYLIDREKQRTTSMRNFELLSIVYRAKKESLGDGIMSPRPET